MMIYVDLEKIELRVKIESEDYGRPFVEDRTLDLEEIYQTFKERLKKESTSYAVNSAGSIYKIGEE